MAKLNKALKEWAAVVTALGKGTQFLLFRKGGISDEGGEFTVEERDFLLYPTFEHQKTQLLKPEFTPLVGKNPNPGFVQISSWARVEKILLADSAELPARFFGNHIWNQSYVDMRLNYKPEKPLYLLALRVFRLPEPVVFEETASYVGCRSWVDLEEAIATNGSLPVIDDAEFAEKLRQFSRVVE